MWPVVDRVEAPIQQLPFISCYLTEGGLVCRQLHLFIALDRLNSLALDEQQTVSGDVRCVGITVCQVASWKRRLIVSPCDALLGSLYSHEKKTSFSSGHPELHEKHVTVDGFWHHFVEKRLCISSTSWLACCDWQRGGFFFPKQIIYLAADALCRYVWISLSTLIIFKCLPPRHCLPFESKWLLPSLADQKHG